MSVHENATPKWVCDRDEGQGPARPILKAADDVLLSLSSADGVVEWLPFDIVRGADCQDDFPVTTEADLNSPMRRAGIM